MERGIVIVRLSPHGEFMQGVRREGFHWIRLMMEETDRAMLIRMRCVVLMEVLLELVGVGAVLVSEC